MKVFISGVAGFLGSHLAEYHINRGADVVGIDNMLGGDRDNVVAGVQFVSADCNDTPAYSSVIAGADIVYHCAAAAYQGLSVNSPRLVYQHTAMSTISLLSAAASGGIGRFVLCSSMARYGALTPPFDEDMEPRPVDPYGWAKLSAEQAVQNICDIHGVEWNIAVPHSIYGPRQRYTDPFRNVLSIMINRILQGKPPIVYGDGSQRRCFSYIDDVIEPLAKLGELGDVTSEVVNIGPDEHSITILELAHLLLALTESELRPVHVPGRPQEVHAAFCSATKARKLLGYQPRWGLEEGAAELLSYIRARGPRPFDYHLPIEIQTASTPATWTNQTM